MCVQSPSSELRFSGFLLESDTYDGRFGKRMDSFPCSSGFLAAPWPRSWDSMLRREYSLTLMSPSKANVGTMVSGYAQKPGHSCVRKIVSYARWPRRPLWRSLHRAWESILKHFGDTGDAWSLDDAARKLQQLHRLPLNPGGDCPICCRCFRAMSRLEGITGDAGQFFEMVDACTAIQEATPSCSPSSLLSAPSSL